MGKKKRFGRVLKGILGLAFLFGLGSLLSGCSLSAADVKLHTKEEMQKIVEERYGEAEFISSDDQEGDKRRRVFTFRDKKYGFTYQVTSRPRGIGLDGSTFYYDGATAYFEYEEAFLAYFKEQEADRFAKQGITLVDQINTSYKYSEERMFSLKEKKLVSTEEKWEEDMKFVWERVHAYKSVPETTADYKLDVYQYEPREFLGTLNAERFVTAEEQRIEYFMQQARYLGGISDITYLRTEVKKVSEVPGLSEQNIYEQKFREGNGKVKVYYYSYEGKEYFIVDTWVAQELESEGIGPIFQYYQSYKHYDIVED